jgi:phosphoribosylaminoimidazole (AIR) synthetase
MLCYSHLLCFQLLRLVLLQTAEMPGLYQPGEYDVAGFAVGSVKQDRVIDGKQIQEGDVLVALPSSGLHSNGFSLVRKVVEVSLHLRTADSVTLVCLCFGHVLSVLHATRLLC